MRELHTSTAAAIVFANTGYEVSHYKRGTLERAVERRAEARGFPSVEAYVQSLADDRIECALLVKELLISVTRFFRDEDAFATLRGSIASLVARAPRERVRGWSAGCATGEEAYSLAMLLSECFDDLGAASSVRLFATDLDDHALAHARAGIYDPSIAKDVGPRRLDRFFVREGTILRVQKELRDRILFAKHDLAADPPFHDLDFVTCRNVLIYFTREVQKQILRVLHYALRPEGLLLVGAAEAADEDLFAPVDTKWRLYRRREISTHRAVGLPLPPFRSSARRSFFPPPPIAPAYERDPVDEQMLATHEELRSTCDDLQMLNTELLNANRALQKRVDEISGARDDLSNLVDASGISAIIVDGELRIQRYTEAVRNVIPLMPSDIGRPLTDFASCLPSAAMIEAASRVLETLESETLSTTNAKGASFVTRIAPYRTHENVIHGFVITVAQMTKAESSSAPARRRRRFTHDLHARGPRK